MEFTEYPHAQNLLNIFTLHALKHIINPELCPQPLVTYWYVACIDVV